MLKHGILGLLNYGSMTGYEIMLTFKNSLCYFWTAQTSQIYRELQTLKKNGWAADKSIPQQGKPDKVYFSITDDGRKELKRWLAEEMKYSVQVNNLHGVSLFMLCFERSSD